MGARSEANRFLLAVRGPNPELLETLPLHRYFFFAPDKQRKREGEIGEGHSTRTDPDLQFIIVAIFLSFI